MTPQSLYLSAEGQVSEHSNVDRKGADEAPSLAMTAVGEGSHFPWDVATGTLPVLW